MSVALLVVRLLLAGAFGFAAYQKLIGPQAFAGAIKAFKTGVPDELVIKAAFMIPWTEAIAAASLLLGLWTRAGALLLSLALLVFIGAIVSVIARGMTDVECGCFGDYSWPCGVKVGWCQLWRNAVLIALTIAVVVAGPGRYSLDARLARR